MILVLLFDLKVLTGLLQPLSGSVKSATGVQLLRASQLFKILKDIATRSTDMKVQDRLALKVAIGPFS